MTTLAHQEYAELAPLGSRQVEAPSALAPVAILVMYDQTDTLQRLEAVAANEHIRLVTCATAEQALLATREQAFDAILIGIPMGRAEYAFSLARDLRVACPGLPIGFFSDHGQLEDRLGAARAGALIYLDGWASSTLLAQALNTLVAGNTGVAARIVLVDNRPRIFCAVVELLEKAAMVVAVAQESDPLLEFLDEHQPHLLILTVGVSRKSALTLCTTVRRSGRWKDLPVLFLSADSSPALRVSAFAAGADDYLERPILFQELVTRIAQRLKRTSARAERCEKDALTGLLMRRSLQERFTSYLGQAQRKHQLLTLGLIDLDNLKVINDRYGHLAGDQVLATLGQLLAKRFRAEDLRCRWGGDEFLIVFPGETSGTVDTVLGGVRNDFEAIVFHGENGPPFQASFAIGVASYPEDGSEFAGLLESADRALYQAKEAKAAKASAG